MNRDAEILNEWRLSEDVIPSDDEWRQISSNDLLDLVRRIRLDERETCAKCADRYREAWRTTVKMDNSLVHHKEAAEKIAAMIRNQT